MPRRENDGVLKHVEVRATQAGEAALRAGDGVKVLEQAARLGPAAAAIVIADAEFLIGHCP
jgi:hypothetical protein